MLTHHRRRTLAALTVAGMLAVAAAGAAQADDISNDLDPSIDAVAEVMSLNVDGDAGTTTLYVTNRNGDGKNGCNLTGGTTLTLALASSSAAVATVSPASVTFTSCGDTKALTVTPVGEGSATISASQTSNDTGGSFNLAPVTFTVNVAPAAPSNTAPTVELGGVAEGASYAKGAVPSATCEVTDTEDGDTSFPATLSAVTGPYASDGIGAQTATCSYTDSGGLTASVAATYAIADPTAPEISYVLDPAEPDGDDGWYRGDVTLTWTVADAESPGSLEETGCDDQVITADQAEIEYSCSATSAGGETGPVSVSIKRDGTAPVVTDQITAGDPGTNGWYLTPVTVTFTASDALSGLSSSSPSPVDVTTDGEGSAVAVQEPVFTDLAGNSSGSGTQSFQVDLSDPTVTLLGAPSGVYYFGDEIPVASCEAGDVISGLAGLCSVSGHSTAIGTHSVTATATDNAGRTATTDPVTYEVRAWTVVGFHKPVIGEGFNTVKAGSTVPLKFELFAGTRELTDVGDVTMSVRSVACYANQTITDMDPALATTGNTVLRYDTTAGQFVYNWKTPPKAGNCYEVTMTADDGSTAKASFKLK